MYNKLLIICDKMKDIINNAENYYKNCVAKDVIEDTYKDILEYNEKILEYKKLSESKIDEDVLEEANDELEELEDLYDDLLDEFDDFIDEFRDSLGDDIDDEILYEELNSR